MTNEYDSDRVRPTNFGYWNELLKNAPQSYQDLFEFERGYLQRVVVKPNSSVLDVGCGDGRSLSDLEGQSRRLLGVDIDEEAINAAVRKYKNNDRINFYKCDFFDLDFGGRPSFDYVLCLNALGNFGSKKNRLVSRMKDFTGHAGQIIVNTFNEDAFDERMKFYRDFNAPIARIDGTTVYFYYEGGEHPSEQFSREQLVSMFVDHDLCPIEVLKRGIGYFARFKRKK